MIPAPKHFTALEGGVRNGIWWCVARNTVFGSVNGYVRVPDDHPLHGLDYDELDDIDVHGGVSFADGDWIGFDTAHFGDYWPGMPEFMQDGHHWTKEEAVAETLRLADQIADTKGNEHG